MLAQNGRQLAVNCAASTSAVEKRFFDVFYRWSSRVGCIAAGARRSSTQTNPEEETHSQKVRKVLRFMPNSVVVLTTMASPTEGVIDWNKPADTNVVDPSLYRGMTLSSFTSLSMSPEPRVTFNIAFPSRTLSALTQTRHFLIHVFKTSILAGTIADAFARGSANEASPAIEGRKGWPPEATLDKLRQSSKYFNIRNHEVKPGPEDSYKRKREIYLPLIECPSAMKSVLECQVLGEGDRAGGGLIRIGDHVLVVAKVTRVLEYGDFKMTLNNKDFTTRGSGLAYCNGIYASSSPVYISTLPGHKSSTGSLDDKIVDSEVSDAEAAVDKAA